MTNNWCFELIASLILIGSTLAAVFIISLITRSAKGHWHGCRPSAEAVIYYSSQCECFEAAIDSLMKSSAARAFDLRIRVVDTEKTAESQRFLRALWNKHEYSFEIE